jgi:hypothetical protein
MAKPNLMERVDILVGEHGKKWKDIISILEEEGYVESGHPLGPNTIRKRYDRWIKAEKKMLPPVEEAKICAERKLAEKKERPPVPKPDDKSDMMVSAKEVLELLKGSIERRDSILASQFQKDHDKEYDAAREQRMEERLTEKVHTMMEALVSDKVSSALEELLEEGGSFQRDIEDRLSALVQEKLSDSLSSLLGGIEIKEKSAGPGRGHKGSTVTKFSATIPEELYDAMKGMGGMFSSHLAAACELYLRARQKHPTHVSKEKATEDPHTPTD